MLSLCLFNLYAEYIMQNDELDETQAGIKIARRNINNLIYADDTTLMAESEEDLKSLFQHHNSKASVLWCSDFFMTQISHSYMTPGKTIALTSWNFVGKIMSLLFNMLFRLVKTFLPRSKRLLILWLQSPSAVIFGAQENKVSHCFNFFPIYLS